MEVGGELVGEVLLDSKIIRNKLYYLVNWLGYSPNDRTWESIENVTNACALLEDFHRRYPEKPGPQSKTTRGTRRFERGIVSGIVLNRKRISTKE